MAVAGDILLIENKSDLITFFILSLIILFFRFYKIGSKKIFIVSIFPIVIIFFSFIIAPKSFAIEKASTWLFLLIGTGILQEILGKDTK